MIKCQKYGIIHFITLYVRIAPWQSLCDCLYMVVISLLPAAKTLAVAAFIDGALSAFASEGGYASVYYPLALILACMVLENILPTLLQLVNASARNCLTLVLKNELTGKQARLEYRHMENKDTCDLINRVCTDPVKSFEDGFQNLLKGAGLILNVASLLAIVLSSTVVGGIAILVAAVPLFTIALRLGQKNYEMGKTAQNIKRRYQYLSDVLTDKTYAEERILFRYGEDIAGQYAALFDQSYQVEARMEIRKYVTMKSGSLVTLLLSFLILLLLLPAIYSGRMTIGVYVALAGAVLNLVQSMSWQLAGIMYEFARLKEYLKEFSDFLILSEKKGAFALPVHEEAFVLESVEFQNVTFRYPDTEKEILKDCSFVLYGDKNYALVGENGAGKTTIIKLLTGLYDNYEGKILINGQDIRALGYGRLKGMIAVVFQDFARYYLSVEENVALGDAAIRTGRDGRNGDGKRLGAGNRMETDEGRIWEALEKVGLDDEVKALPEGIHTSLGKIYENSSDLSGGQWQKLAIARLLYSDAAIHVLDEPTAAMDPVAEARLYELFHSVKKEKFTIYITHRMGAARIADEILVIGDGRVQEQGSHEQLAGYENGIYREMYQSQKELYA